MPDKKKSRRARLRIRPEEALLVFLFLMIGIGTIFFGDYAVRQYRFSEASRGYYSENAFGLYAHTDQKGQTLDCFEIVCRVVSENDGVSVSRYLGGTSSVTRLGTVFSQCPYEPRIIEGRYFTAADFYSGRRLCVLGKDFKPAISAENEQLVTEDGVTYFITSGVRYEVIGTMGYDLNSAANYSAILNLDALSVTLSYTGSRAFVIDAADQKTADRVQTQLCEWFAAHGATAAVVEIPKDSMSVSEFFNMDLLNLIMLLFGAFAVVLSTVPLTLMWAQRRKKRAAVQRLLGFSGSFVLGQMLGRLLVLFHIGFLLSFGVYNLIARLWYLGVKSFFSPEMGIAYLGALVFNLLIAVVPFVQTMRVDPGDALRRE